MHKGWIVKQLQNPKNMAPIPPPIPANFTPYFESKDPQLIFDPPSPAPVDGKVFWKIIFIIFLDFTQRYTYRVLQTIQMKLILLCVWAEPAVLGSAKTALKLKYEI